MAEIIVYGLPKKAHKQLIVRVFRNKFKRRLSFWLTEIKTDDNEPYNTAILDFKSIDQAEKAYETLQNFLFKFNEKHYQLSCEFISKKANSGGQKYEEVDNHEEYIQEHVPRKRRKTNKSQNARMVDDCEYDDVALIDKQMELLREKKLIMEKEQELMMRKMEFERMQEKVKRPPPSPAPAKKTVQPKKPVMHPEDRRKIVPNFSGPISLILRELHPLIQGHSENERLLLVSLMKAEFRKRFAIALEGKPFMRSKELYNLYRELYPESTDAAFVDGMKTTIKESFLPGSAKMTQTPAKQETNTSGSGNTSNSGAVMSEAIDAGSKNSMVSLQEETNALNNDDKQVDGDVNNSDGGDGDGDVRTTDDINEEQLLLEDDEKTNEQGVKPDTESNNKNDNNSTKDVAPETDTTKEELAEEQQTKEDKNNKNGPETTNDSEIQQNGDTSLNTEATKDAVEPDGAVVQECPADKTSSTTADAKLNMENEEEFEEW